MSKTIYHFDQTGEKMIFQNQANKQLQNQELGKGANDLFDAIEAKDVEMVEKLLESGSDPNCLKSRKVVFAISSKNKSISSNQQVTLHEITPLMLALNDVETKEGKHKRSIEQKKIIDLLLFHGADVNIADKTHNISPVKIAANYNDVESLEKLINKGANVNTIATLCTKYQPCEDRGNVTPLLLAINMKDKFNSGKCIDLLFNAGARIDLNKTFPNDVVTIINGLSWSNPQKAHEYLEKILKEDTKRLDYNNVMYNLDSFLSNDLENNFNTDKFVGTLLGISNNLKSSMGAGKYLAHLKSWNGLLSYSKDKKFFFDSSSGWHVNNQIPRKITNMLYALKKLHKGNIDTSEKFGEDKKTILDKVKDEIYNQITNYHTAYSIFILNRAFVSRVSIYERDEQRQRGVPYPKKLEPYIYAQAAKWSKCISKLEKGKSFSFSAGSSNHAIFIEFKRQKNGDFSRKIYNLGAGKNLHSVSLDNLYYPSVVTDIPKELFDKNNPKLLEYFFDIIISKANIWGEQHFTLYDNDKLGGLPMKSTNGLIPMKYQVTGNCSVKNNMCGMKNRLKNNRLYSFLKNFEINELKDKVCVPNEMFNNKELEKDIATIEKIASKRLSYGECIEKEMFRFLKKRCEKISAKYTQKQGVRIQKAIENMNNNILKRYVESTPDFLKMLKKIAITYDLNELNFMIKRLKMRRNKNKIDLEDLKKDIDSKDMKELNKRKDIISLEEDLFKILKKRFKGDLRKVGKKRGVRIYKLTKNIPGKVLDFYVKKNPFLLKSINEVAIEYKVSDLKSLVDLYNEKYSIKSAEKNKKTEILQF